MTEFIQDYIFFFPRILKGVPLALLLTVIGITFGSLLGIILAFMKIGKIKILKFLASFYIWIFRGTPMMVQLYFLYFGLPAVGINLKPISAASIGLSLNIAAYMAETIRSGIAAVDKGQFEAAYSLGLNKFQTMKRIIVPQAFRIILPTLGNEFITLLKDTSLASAITLTEVLKLTYQLSSASFKPLPAYAVAATIYLALTTFLSFAFDKLEKKLSIY